MSLGLGLLSLTALLLWAASIPALIERAARRFEPRPLDLSSSGLLEAGAIVVLGRRLHRGADGRGGGPTLDAEGLERVRQGARLHHLTRLPILLSGGDPAGLGVSEAEVMRQRLEGEAGIVGAWCETTSQNTRENAQRSAALLHARDIERIFLVTHAVDFSRAARNFSDCGVEVVPAVVGFFRAEQRGLARYFPSRAALAFSATLTYEALATLRDRLRSASALRAHL